MISTKRGPLIVGIAAAVLIVLVVVLLVMPQSSKVSSAQDELESARDQQQSLQSQLSVLQDDERNAAESRAIIEDAEQQVPPTADEPGYLLLLKNAATRSGIEVASIDSGTPTLDTTLGVSRIPVTVTVTGNYFAIVEFFYSLETFPRAVLVDSTSISPEGEDASGSPTLTVSASLTLFTTDADAGPGSAPGGSADTGDDGGSASPAPTVPGEEPT
jgi:Tfp pilus assembly protein PilO